MTGDSLLPGGPGPLVGQHFPRWEVWGTGAPACVGLRVARRGPDAGRGFWFVVLEELADTPEWLFDTGLGRLAAQVCERFELEPRLTLFFLAGPAETVWRVRWLALPEAGRGSGSWRSLGLGEWDLAPEDPQTVAQLVRAASTT
jgi:hypothetical protein